MQDNGNWTLGAALGASSTDNGPQYELEILWKLLDGNWWLYLNGADESDAVGYYPGSLYNGGALAIGATNIDFGGEVVCQTSWPPMWSGTFAATGYEHAAYQRDIYYFDETLRQQSANLTWVQDSPKCYTVLTGIDPDPWNANIFFGGLGGETCQ